MYHEGRTQSGAVSTAGLVALSGRPHVGPVESGAGDEGVCPGDQGRAKRSSGAHGAGQPRLLSLQSLTFGLVKFKGAQVPPDRRAVGSAAQGLLSMPPTASELGADGRCLWEALTADTAGE